MGPQSPPSSPAMPMQAGVNRSTASPSALRTVTARRRNAGRMRLSVRGRCELIKPSANIHQFLCPATTNSGVNTMNIWKTLWERRVPTNSNNSPNSLLADCMAAAMGFCISLTLSYVAFHRIVDKRWIYVHAAAIFLLVLSFALIQLRKSRASPPSRAQYFLLLFFVGWGSAITFYDAIF